MKMVSIDTLSLGEFRKATANLPDDTALLVTLDGAFAIPVQEYPFETSLTAQGVVLLEVHSGDAASEGCVEFTTH